MQRILKIMNDNALAIQNLIARFASSFDLKDWSALKSCLTPQVFTDYSDLRGTPPETISAAEYIRLRREALALLNTHHLLGNLEIEFSAPRRAICRISMIIWRVYNLPKDSILREVSGEFHTHCIYIFNLIHETDVWKIGGITQKVLWSSGSSEIHSGVKA